MNEETAHPERTQEPTSELYVSELLLVPCSRSCGRRACNERPPKQKAEQMIGTSGVSDRDLDRALKSNATGSRVSRTRTRSRHDRAACHDVRISLNRGANWRNVARCLGLLRGPLAWEYNMRGKRCRCRRGMFVYVGWAEASGGGWMDSGRVLNRIVRPSIVQPSIVQGSGGQLSAAVRNAALRSAVHQMGVVGCVSTAGRRER
jgi:hypothetical protein